MSTRIEGIVDKVSDAEHFSTVEWVLGKGPITNFVQSTVDSKIKANLEFQGKAGLPAKVVRKSRGYCCEWCNSLIGEYEYPDVPPDVYRRHDNCNCIVTYYPGDGRKQNVHTKAWNAEDPVTLGARKTFNTSKATVTVIHSENPGKLENVPPGTVSVDKPGKAVYHGDEEHKRYTGIQERTAKAISNDLGGTVEYIGTGPDARKLTWEGKKYQILDGRSQNLEAQVAVTRDVDGIVIDMAGQDYDKIFNALKNGLAQSQYKKATIIFTDGEHLVKVMQFAP